MSKVAHYSADKSTRRVYDNPELEKQIKAIQDAKGIPDEIKATSIAGLRASAKQPTGAEIHNAAKEGSMDLINILGPHSPKRMSHNVVRNIAQHAEFFLKYLDEVWANYDS